MSFNKWKVFENIMGKGENAGNQQFLLFPQCFLTFKNESKRLNFSSSNTVNCNET